MTEVPFFRLLQLPPLIINWDYFFLLQESKNLLFLTLCSLCDKTTNIPGPFGKSYCYQIKTEAMATIPLFRWGTDGLSQDCRACLHWQHFSWSSTSHFKKNEIKHWQRKGWVIPPEQNGSFVANMEMVLDVYKRPLDPLYPVVCMDESPKQLIAETKVPIPASSGEMVKHDYEYKRCGVCNVFLAREPWRKEVVGKRKGTVIALWVCGC